MKAMAIKQFVPYSRRPTVSCFMRGVSQGATRGALDLAGDFVRSGAGGLRRLQQDETCRGVESSGCGGGSGDAAEFLEQLSISSEFQPYQDIDVYAKVLGTSRSCTSMTALTCGKGS